MSLKVTTDGELLIKEWINAQKRHREAQREVNSADCALRNAQDNLVKWLVPKAAKVGECYCIPVGETFLDVRIAEKVSHMVEGGGVHKSLEYVLGWRNMSGPHP